MSRHQNNTRNPQFNRPVHASAQFASLETMQFDDAPQTLKPAMGTRVPEHIEVISRDREFVILEAQLLKLRPTKAGSADLYATGTFRDINGLTINVNVTRRYEAREGGIKAENASLKVEGSSKLVLRIMTACALRTSSTGVSTLYAAINGAFEVKGRGWFNISLSAYKK